MARPGPAGKNLKHGHSNVSWTEVDDEPYTGPSPDLPKLTRRKKWHALVEQWWEIVRHMPHAALWTPSDWQFGLELALLKNAYWEMFDEGEATAAQATEIRRREEQLGTTAEARRKLLIRYVEVRPDEPVGEAEYNLNVVEETGDEPASREHSATVTPLADRRLRLTSRTG